MQSYINKRMLRLKSPWFTFIKIRLLNYFSNLTFNDLENCRKFTNGIIKISSDKQINIIVVFHLELLFQLYYFHKNKAYTRM